MESRCFLGHDAGVDDFYEQFGRRVRSARLSLNLNQEELGHQVGLERSSISNVEKGRQRIQLHMLLKFAAALNVPPEDLLPDSTAISDPLRNVPADTRRFVRDVLNTAKARSRA